MRWPLALAPLLILVAACCPLPEGYYSVSPGEYAWRAMSSKGVIVGYRERSNDPGASLEFWAAAVEKELTVGRGYRLESKAEFPDGIWLRFVTPDGQGYLVMLLVDEDTIRTLEAGGP
ncbi:MAG TPA: hypothetical protein VI643_00025, partial [Planctomycetota bacterium]|nr:hypothetical protein [Planctomycetota bacterium]